MNARIRVLLILWLALAVFLLVGALTATRPARAHDALPTAATPQGWTYPSSCCSDRDCRRAEDGEVEEVSGGYYVKPLALFVPHGDERIKLSGDKYIHLCIGTVDMWEQRAIGALDPWLICLFIPATA